jgi:hypothetical protein
MLGHIRADGANKVLDRLRPDREMEEAVVEALALAVEVQAGFDQRSHLVVRVLLREAVRDVETQRRRGSREVTEVIRIVCGL